jgi:FkbM family methyltransferase
MASLIRQVGKATAQIAGRQIIRAADSWELIEQEQLRRFLKWSAADCVFDVGANCGQYAARLRKLGFRGIIISFEPNPDAAEKLHESARGDSKWFIHETALDQFHRQVKLKLMKRSVFTSLHEPDHSQTSHFTEMNAVEREVTITTETLASLFPELRARHGFTRPFLKLDTQGHDLSVVLGAGPCINEFVGLQSELSLVRLYKESPDMHEALENYGRLGFKLSALVPNNAGHFPDLYEIDCIMYNPQLLA